MVDSPKPDPIVIAAYLDEVETELGAVRRQLEREDVIV